MSQIPTWKSSLLDDNCTFKTFFSGKIRDSIHNTIPFTDCEKKIIDTQEFQRLRRITQTAFTYYAFPGASHSRFEHSLGVMHVAWLTLNSLITNQKKLINSIKLAFQNAPKDMIKLHLSKEKEQGSLLKTEDAITHLENSPYLVQCLRFAALLHDIGHPPFSHTGERFMMSWQEFSNLLPTLGLPEWLNECFQKKMMILKSKNKDLSNFRIRHEIYSLLIIHKIFSNKENELLSPKMAQDICSILDLTVKPCHESKLEKSGLQNFFHEIISGDLDADRMDYLLRDSVECGVVYGYYDLGRILDSFGFYYNEQTNKYHLAIRKSGLSSFEDYLRARLSMYHQVYFHKTVAACEAMIEHFSALLPEFSLPLNIDEYQKLDDHNFYYYIDKHYQKIEHEYPKKILFDLLFKRKIWKRIYEECILKNSANTAPSLCPVIFNMLKNLNYSVEIIESSTNLTAFIPKGRDLNTKNNFKIILKDVHSFRSLEPIELHSTLINRVDEEIITKRIYVSPFKEDGEEVNIKDIQKTISIQILNPEKMLS